MGPAAAASAGACLSLVYRSCTLDAHQKRYNIKPSLATARSPRPQRVSNRACSTTWRRKATSIFYQSKRVLVMPLRAAIPFKLRTPRAHIRPEVLSLFGGASSAAVAIYRSHTGVQDACTAVGYHTKGITRDFSSPSCCPESSAPNESESPSQPEPERQHCHKKKKKKSGRKMGMRGGMGGASPRENPQSRILSTDLGNILHVGPRRPW